jgi:hypothetical protein
MNVCRVTSFVTGFVAAVAVAGACMVGCAPTTSHVPVYAPIETEPSTPFDVQLGLIGESQAGAQQVVVKVTSQRPARHVRVSIRGVDGLRVKAPDRSVVSLLRGDYIEVRGTMVLPKAHRATLAVDVSWGRANDERSTTVAALVGDPLLPYPNKPLGTLALDDKGRPIELLSAEMRPRPSL